MIPSRASKPSTWWRALLAVLSLLLALTAHAAAGHGYVDAARVDGRVLTVSGWAASGQPTVFVTNAIVRLDGREVYRGRMDRQERPDVADSTGRPEWRQSGFEVRLRLPRSVAEGAHRLEVRARRGDGQEFDLSVPARWQQIVVDAAPQPPVLTGLLLVLAAALPLATLLAPWQWAQRRGVDRAQGLAAALGLSFLLLVATGATGSSLALLLRPPSVVDAQAPTWMGQPQMVRSDEWEVITPLAIAQGAHQPRWPVVNHHLGEDGQNMLVIGMTGMPVAHLSALAKPATWGHFLFDLRRALAWVWWLPLFGGFGAVWWLLRRLTGLPWQPAAALAGCAVLAPYSVAFSHWPAYLLMFAALGLVAFDRLLHATRAGAALAWGGVLGWCAAGYAFVLYPAWQISLASLCAPLALAWAWRERAHWRWNWRQSLGTLLALALAGAWLLAWWLDARDAVAVMRDTIYPGGRSTETGGDIDRWFLLKGWLNPFTLHVNSPMVASEAASFQFLWLPTLALVGWQALRTRRLDPVAAVLAGFALFALGFQFIGIPPALARATLWGSVTAYRLDLALGFTQLLLLAWWLAPGDPAHTTPRPPRAIAGLLAAALLAQGAWEVTRMPLHIRDGLPAGVLVAALLASAGAAALWAGRRRGAFIALYGGWTLAAVLPFHPLGQAPAALPLAAPLAAAGLQHAPASDAGRRGTAVVGTRTWALTLPAAGAPVINSVFYHPQPSLWRRLDPEGRQRGVYNRYQRLLLELGPQPDGPGFALESPRLDEVRLTLDPVRFDFRLLGARHVLAPAGHTAELSANPSLTPVHGGADAARGYALFLVRP